MSHPLLVFSTLVLRITERYEPEGGGDRPHHPTEPRQNPDIHLGQIKQQHFSVAVGCEF